MSSPTTQTRSQEQEISQEFKDFISTLPKEKTLITRHIYQHQGFWYHEKILAAVISCQKHFEAKDSDVIVATNPKCGTTWIKAITFAVLKRTRHPVVGKDHPLLTNNAHDLVPFIDMNLHEDGKIPDMESFPSPRLFATHMPYVALPDSIKNNSKCKLIYMARNPKDSFVSLWHFLGKVGYLDTAITIEEAFEYFCKGLTAYGPIWDHVLEYWKLSLENPERVLFLKYEDMKAQPAVQLRRLAEFLDCPFSADEDECGVVDQILKLCNFDNLSSLEVNKNGKLVLTAGVENSVFFRRGEVGDWKNHLSVEMAKRVDQITQDKFRAAGLFL